MKLPTSHIYVNTVPNLYKDKALFRVRSGSPIRLLKEVKRFDNYFQRELDGSQQYDPDDKTDYTAYLLVSDCQIEPVWAGACCFRSRSYIEFGSDVQTLDWVWVHPFYRREGLLSSHWKTLRKAHGDFFVRTPHSIAMQQFLIEHNTNSKFADFYRCNRQTSSKVERTAKDLK